MIYNRISKSIDEDIQYGNKYLNFLYHNFLGRMLLKLVVNSFFSKIYGLYNNTTISKNKINKFIEKYDISINEYEEKEFSSFNSFFIRKKKIISYDKNNSFFISPADSKLMVYKIKDNMTIKIKQSIYTIDELLLEQIDSEQFRNGNCLVFRLSLDDYHRYCYIDDGIMEKTKKIKGKLHTVSSISKNHKIYSQNTRICTYLTTDNFGKIIFIEVGALLVGRIVNYNKERFTKGEEKGYFELGGSTIVILTNDKIKIDNDILEYSRKGIETKVKYGEKIGELKC